ncbi:hypothetical protein BGZ73_005533, partial [Actinomortierella ambigua]
MKLAIFEKNEFEAWTLREQIQERIARATSALSVASPGSETKPGGGSLSALSSSSTSTSSLSPSLSPSLSERQAGSLKQSSKTAQPQPQQQPQQQQQQQQKTTQVKFKPTFSAVVQDSLRSSTSSVSGNGGAGTHVMSGVIQTNNTTNSMSCSKAADERQDNLSPTPSSASAAKEWGNLGMNAGLKQHQPLLRSQVSKHYEQQQKQPGPHHPLQPHCTSSSHLAADGSEQGLLKTPQNMTQANERTGLQEVIRSSEPSVVSSLGGKGVAGAGSGSGGGIGGGATTSSSFVLANHTAQSGTNRCRDPQRILQDESNFQCSTATEASSRHSQLRVILHRLITFACPFISVFRNGCIFFVLVVILVILFIIIIIPFDDPDENPKASATPESDDQQERLQPQGAVSRARTSIVVAVDVWPDRSHDAESSMSSDNNDNSSGPGRRPGGVVGGGDHHNQGLKFLIQKDTRFGFGGARSASSLSSSSSS